MRLQKQFTAIIMATALVISAVPVSYTYAEENAVIVSKKEEIPLQTASGRDASHVIELDGTWKFGGKNLSDEKALSADYSSWDNVTIPHTWNATDGEDGGGNYVRAAYWYHHDFSVEEITGKRIYIEFLGANTKTDVYINGEKAGESHKGGYTAFRYDITKLVTTGNNTMDVRVDNTINQEIAPISGDFNMYGGIYRRVYLITTDDVHVDLDDDGSSGLFLTTGNMRSMTRPDDFGEFKVNANLVNDGNTERKISVTTHIEGTNAPKDTTDSITIKAGGTYNFEKDCKVENPTLWEGIDYSKDSDNSKAGYQYKVTLTLKENDKVIDEVSDKIGFRYFYIDSLENGESGEGFFLNGKKYPLRGVNRHSCLAGVGSAMTEQQHYEDMAIMKELGVNTIRLCHYPHTDYFYDLCDDNGIVVWTEIPLVNIPGSAAGFEDVTKLQLTELIKQQFNRPSVCFWGLENEIGNGTSLTSATANAQVKKAKQLMYNLDNLAHELDKTGRYTTQAVNRDYSMDNNDPESVNKNFENNIGWKSDIVAWNIYPGWYPDANFYGTFDDVMKRKTVLDSRSMGISEYGWGANVNQHEENPELGKNNLTSGGKWHPEEYQNIMNEEALDYINNHDELWGTYYWVMFDFAVDSRNEGSQIALNDKGLVTADRKIKKDSFYLYKANWNKKDSFTYITSRRWDNREISDTDIKVYSNCDEVELFLNDKSLGKMESRGNGVFVMKDVSLEIGQNVVKSVGKYIDGEQTYIDSCTFMRKISSKAELASDSLSVNTELKTVALDKKVSLAEFKEIVKGVSNATYQVFDKQTEVTDDTQMVSAGMTIKVTSEDKTTTETYYIKSKNLCYGKPVTVTSYELTHEKEYAVDGDADTRWTAVDGSYPQSITVDLEDAYYLSNLNLSWDPKDGNRYYEYYVEVSEDGKNYTEVIDRRNNTQIGEVFEEMEFVKGRYIRITATGCNQAGWMTLFEISADGYMLSSDTYKIDEENKLIILDEIPQTGLAEGIFGNNLQIAGNYLYRVNLSSGWIVDGNTVDIIDDNGESLVTYTICTEQTKKQYIDEQTKLAKPVIKSVTNQKKGIKISWKKTKNAKGYFLYRKTNSKNKKLIATIKDEGTLSYIDKKATKNGANYKYYIVAFRNETESSSSTVKQMVYLRQSKIFEILNSSSKVINISYEKNEKADGYEIVYSTDAKFSKAKKKIVSSKNKCDIKNLQKGKTYYFKVRSFKKDGKKAYYSVFSKTQKVKIKK